MIGRIFRSVSRASLILIMFGCILLGVMVKDGTFPQILFPSKDYDYVLDNGLQKGQHFKGEIYYCLGGFASMETYTQYENYRTAGKTSGYYYMIPVGEGGMAAVYVRDADKSLMDRLTDETEEYLMGGEAPQTGVQFNGVAVTMRRNLSGLESAFKSELTDIGYTQSEIDEMIASYTDGEYLVLYGPADVSIVYVMMAIGLVLILIGILLFVRRYRQEAAYDRAAKAGMTKPQDVTKRDLSDDSQTTYYVER